MCEPVSATTAAMTAAGLAADGTALAAPAAATGILGTGISGSTALGIGATAASTGLSMMGRMASSAQTASLYIQNALNQNRALAQNYNGLGLQQQQIADKAATDNFDVARGMVVAKGKADAAAGEAGVSGVSFSNVLSDLEMRDGLATGTNDANYTNDIQGAQNRKDAARSSTVSNISGTPQASPMALYAGLGADAITAGLKIYDLNDKSPLFKGSATPTGS